MIAFIGIIAFSSCSSEIDEPIGNRDGEVTTSISVGLPQAIQTYAESSDLSGLANLKDQNLKVRFIMEVYPKNSTELAKRMICYKSLTTGVDYTHATFSDIRLVAAEYNFVFWADIVRTTTQIDDNAGPDLNSLITVANGVSGNRYLVTPSVADGTILEDDAAIVAYNTGSADHYELTNLQNIQFGNATDTHFDAIYGEMNDAYRNVTSIDLRQDTPIGDIELKRPFAKLRVITTDGDVLKGQNVKTSDVEVRPTFSENIPSTFNVLTNKATGSISSFATLQKSVASYKNETGDDLTVGVWYCIPPTKNPNVTLSVIAAGLCPYPGIDIPVANVPLVENKLTTIKGKLFSKQTDITIYISDDLTGETTIELDKEVSNQADLMASLTGESEQIKYTGKVTKEEGLTLDFTNLTRSEPKYNEGNTSVLSLSIPNIEEDAVITIKGDAYAPYSIVLNTGAKCSIRINAPKTKVVLGGTSYKNILYNYSIDFVNSDNKPIVDSFFVVDSDDVSIVFPSNIDTHHLWFLNQDFTIKNEKCDNHGKSCTAIEAVKSWLESNSGKTVWEYVGDSNN